MRLAGALGVALLGAACAPTCPEPLHADPARRAAILARAGPLATPPRAVCFDAITHQSAITPDGVARLDARLGTDEAAARLAHLAHHLSRRGPDAGPECVASWLRSEVEGITLELRLRRELGVAAPVAPYPFEEAHRAASTDAARRRLIEAHLWGSGHMRGYQARCRVDGR